MATIITWNMEGAKWDDPAKSPWTTLAGFINKGVHLTCIQEAGAYPKSSEALAIPGLIGDPVPAPTRAKMFYGSWNHTSRKAGYRIFWLDNPHGGDRVNLALMCGYDQVPSNLIYIKPAPFGTSRPPIGFQFGTEQYISVHSLSGGGGDSTTLLRYIENRFLAGTKTYVFGDYNCQPPDLGGRFAATPGYPLQAGHICPPDKVTRPKSDKKYDYAVRYDTPTPLLGSVYTNYDQDADHRPVQFDF